MPSFKCFVRGENFPGKVAGIEEAVGFYVTRTVEALDESDAEAMAVKALQGEAKLKAAANAAGSEAARIFVEEIEAVSDRADDRIDTGFVFFRMSDSG